MTIAEALVDAATRLGGATPRLDAELLMAHAMGIEREALLLSTREDAAPAAFAALVARRLAHEPIAYIIGRRAFWTIDVAVAPGVLVPRPDSETLLEAAVAHFGTAGPATVLDLGTGPGTLLLAALDQWREARGLGIDISPAALRLAAANAARLGLADRATFAAGDWAGAVDGRFDLILCNPPYIESGAALPAEVARWEPAGALFAGADGLDAYRRIVPALPRLLAADGIACVEVGAGQAEAVARLFAGQGLRVALRRDLAGIDRCLVIHA